MHQCLRIQHHALFFMLCLVPLGGCYAPVVQQLEAIPLPAAPQMANLAPPKCATAQAIDEATEDPPVAEKTGKDGGRQGTQLSGDSERDLKRERDCYRHAERAARASLTRLQASTAGTLTALDEMKRSYTHAGTPRARAGRGTPF